MRDFDLSYVPYGKGEEPSYARGEDIDDDNFLFDQVEQGLILLGYFYTIKYKYLQANFKKNIPKIIPSMPLDIIYLITM